MSRFTFALEDALRATRQNRSDVARKLSKSTSTVNSWFRAEYRPSKQVLSDLLSILPAEDFGKILIAHLQDESPDDAEALLRLSYSQTKPKEKAKIADLPPELRDLVEWLGTKALNNPALRQGLSLLRDSIR